MSAKHTPGPWTAKHTPGAGLSVHANVSKALGPRYSSDCPVYHVGRDACTMAIAYELWTQFPREEWDAMQQANAALIAAAPDLLREAESAVRRLDWFLNANPDHVDSTLNVIRADLRAVIAKARALAA